MDSMIVEFERNGRQVWEFRTLERAMDARSIVENRYGVTASIYPKTPRIVNELVQELNRRRLEHYYSTPVEIVDDEPDESPKLIRFLEKEAG